jgi:hypothetical protein
LFQAQKEAAEKKKKKMTITAESFDKHVTRKIGTDWQ